MPKLINRHLMLVNRHHPLEKEAEPHSLVVTTDCQFPVKLLPPVAIALQRLFTFIDSGNQIVQISGYRDFATQAQLYEDSLQEHGREFTESYVAFPGTSEHQTGLAVDVGLNGPDLDYLCPSFPDEGICLAFKEVAGKFGFILRYPAGKRAITGIAHEPWHFRYVGYPHSQIISDNHWTLEEYIEELQQATSLATAYSWGPYEIVTVAEKALLTFFETLQSDQTIVDMSQTNCGGLIVTYVTEGKESYVYGA